MMQRPRRGGSRSGMTLLEITIVLGIIAIVVGMGLPLRNSYVIATREAGAQQALRQIHGAQLAAQNQGLVDLDGRPPAEFLYLGELTGQEPLREIRAGDARWGERRLVPPLVSPGFQPVGPGIFEKGGYLFRIELLDEAGLYLPELRELQPPRFPDPDTAETQYTIVAWPAKAGYTGRHAFEIDEGGDITVLKNEAAPPPADPGGNPSGPYVPAPPSALVPALQTVSWVGLVCTLEHTAGLALSCFSLGWGSMQWLFLRQRARVRAPRRIRELMPPGAKLGLSILILGIGAYYVPFSQDWSNASAQAQFHKNALCGGVERPPPPGGF